jgi:hypothetical protein
VPIVFHVLLGLVAIIPVVAMIDGQMLRDVVTLLVLVALAIVVKTSTAADASHAAVVSRRLRLFAAVPLIWLVVQIMPLPAAFSNSIWAAAATALRQPLSGHISVDIGYTTEAAITYATSVALIMVAIFAVKDRGRAELLLYCLSIVTTFTVIELWFFELAPGLSVGELATAHYREMLTGTAAQGAILNFAASLRTMERRKSWNSEGQLFRSALYLLALYLACFAICLLAIGLVAPTNVGIATSFGVISLLLLEVVRRDRLAAWSALTLGASFLLMSGMIVTWRYNSAQSMSITLRFSEASVETAAAVQRMLSDSRWVGNGAGTFPALWPTYHHLGGAAQAPTAAASILIGGGRVFFLIAIAGAASLFSILFLGALARRRDSIYPAAAAASVAILFGEAFCDASLQTASVTLISAMLIGLGLTQSVSPSQSVAAVRAGC